MRPTAELLAIAHDDEPDVEPMALLIGRHVDPLLDDAAALEILDSLADGVSGHDGLGVCRHVFGEAGLGANREAYHDPSNSVLHEVLATGRGIPITLAVVAMCVAHRIGVRLHGVALPGHFLIGTDQPGRYVDPFEGTRGIDAAGAERILARMHPGLALELDMLEQAPTIDIGARMLANLDVAFAMVAGLHELEWVTGLAARWPGAGEGPARRHARVLERLGRFDEAAGFLDERADALGSDELHQVAMRLVARCN